MKPLILVCGLWACTGTFGAVFTFDYDPAGRLTGLGLPSGEKLAYQYDPAGNILSQGVADNADSDQDGLPDAWEQQYFGSLNENAAGDFDRDGQSNGAEFNAGTNPADASSGLRIVAVSASAATGAQLQISSVPGKTYKVQSRNLLNGGAWEDRATLTANATTLSWSDPAPLQGQRYYRVVLVP